MDSVTIILLLISLVTALGLALFQYRPTLKSYHLRQGVLIALRTLTLFALFLLLINPKFERIRLLEDKPNLVVAIDNSRSMAHLGVAQDALDILDLIQEDSRLTTKFDVDVYKFGKDFQTLDSLSFNDTGTDFSKLLKSYNEVYKNDISPMILLSDGNQTYGSDVSFIKTDSNNRIFSVIMGDTTQYEDLSITKVNHNRYVFHKNKFEIEVLVNYQGSQTRQTKLQILNKDGIVYATNLEFNATNRSKVLTAILTANSIGVQNYRVEILPLDQEQNTVNNTKEFAVEVIDQKTNIALVSSTPHPDVGALKKSITRNDQRAVDILKPDDYIESADDYQLVILYQPNNTFKELLETIFESDKNTLVLTGSTTDWELLNRVQPFYNQEVTYQEEYYQPVLNPAYSPFILNDLEFDNYPPLVSEFGTITFNTNINVALYKSVNSNQTSFPQLVTIELTDEKHGLLLGEGIWRWRSQCYLNTGSFEEFDVFIGKLVQYLSSNKRRTRLVVDHESFYNSNDDIVINAQFFNKSYEPDNSANLYITIVDELGSSQTYPLLYSDAGYKVDLSGLVSGSYQFTVSNKEEQVSRSGSFKVIAFNIEQQFINPDVTRLEALATNSGGQVYGLNSTSDLIDQLIEDQSYVAIQKELRTVVPLIDWYYLLGLIALALSLEWFIRKYNGLI